MLINTKAQKSLFIAGFTSAAILSAQGEDERELEESTILASRFEGALDDSVSTVSVISGADLGRLQEYRLTESLDLLPGIQGFSTAGQTGNFESLQVRGFPTRYTQVIVDGVRTTDSTNGLNNFITNAGLGQVNQIEFLRGPQSVLYGGEAVGGVLGYDTAVGGEQKTTLFAEAGSFDSYRTSLSTSGELGDLEYGVQIGSEFTENDTDGSFPVQDFELNSAVIGLKWNATDDLSFKLTYRGSDGDLETRTVSSFGFFTSDVNTDSHLFALNSELRVNDLWTTKLTLGYYEEANDSSFDGSLGSSIFETDTSRFSLNWNNKIVVTDEFDFVAGFEYSDTDFSDSNGADVDFATKAAYVNSYWKPVEGLLIEAGVRYEDHDEYGGETAWNLGAAYDVASTGTRFRARVAESFRTPTLTDTEAFSGLFSNQLANPDLETESILGFEFGVDQKIGDTHFLELTYFDQELDGAIFTQTITAGFPSVTQRQNSSGDSSVSGFEFAARGSFYEERLKYRVAWTVQLDEDIIDVPDHLVSADLNYDAGKWLVGIGASYVTGASYGSPDDTNFVTTDDRFLTRIYGHYKISENIKLHARVENVLDEEYRVSDIFGTQIEGQGFGAFAGFSIDF